MKIITQSSQYFVFAAKEFLVPVTYLSAIFIGLVINSLTTGNPFNSAVPFIVSMLVQIFSKAGVKYKNRFSDYLLMLPGERTDPAFVTDVEGQIIVSSGNTTVFLEEKEIKNINDIFPSIDLVYHFDQVAEKHEEIYSLELFSLPLERWYQVKFKCQRYRKMILVWLEDITLRKTQEEKLLLVKQFSTETTSSLKQLVKTRDTEERVAMLILREEYEAVYIARESGGDALKGHVYKFDGNKLRKSSLIISHRNADNPVWKSRLNSSVVRAEKVPSQRLEDFLKEHHFNDQVKEFIEKSIVNYINYHEGDLSLIAFNKKEGINKFDETLIETIANTALSITYLTELAIANDERFLQSIHGLCSAAEYSDEQTGKHILRVNEYSRLIAERMGFSTEFQEVIGEVAAIHDIGKVAMPEIIKLPRLLTAEERGMVEMHTVYGAGILSQMIELATVPDFRLEMARKIALNHHQCWNGGGYPALIDSDDQTVNAYTRGFVPGTHLRPPMKEEIPIEALIVSLADSYDALRGARHYKPEFSHEKTLSILAKDDRTRFSGEERFGKDLYTAFKDTASEFDKIYSSMI